MVVRIGFPIPAETRVPRASMTPVGINTAPLGARARVSVGGLEIDPVTQDDVLDTVARGWAAGQGGTIVTPNVDIWRQARVDESLQELVKTSSLVVADGQPLVWASRLSGEPLPERVTGSGLVESLCATAAEGGRSVYLIGGGVGDTATRAAHALAGRHAGLRIAGVAVPPLGFDRDDAQLAALVEQVADSAADLVLVGLGFPKQERLGRMLAEQMPAAWILGCGAGIAMAAGDTKRPSTWVQAVGAEWLVRLVQEPGRLWRRYLVDDLPAAAVLATESLRARARGSARHSPPHGHGAPCDTLHAAEGSSGE